MDAESVDRAPELPADFETRYRTASRALSDAATMTVATRDIQRVAGQARATLRIILGLPALRAQRPQRIVVFSGSFNPLTTAHIGLVEAALANGYAAAVWLLPAASIDKERVSRAALVDRLAQMRAYVLTTRRQSLALVNRGLYYEQARLLHRMFPDAELALLVGFDKVPQIFDARYYRDRDAALRSLFHHVRLLVAPRAGAGEAELAQLLARPENAPFAPCVTFLPTPPELAEESSTAARAAASAGRAEELRALVPPEGVALADTGAYDTEGVAPSGNRYAQRLAWLRTLEQQ